MKTKAVGSREIERNKLLEKIQEKIEEQNGDFGADNFYRILLHLFNKQLPLPRGEVGKENVPQIIPWDKRQQAFCLFRDEVLREIKKFQDSEEEGKDLLARLLVWTAGKIAESYHSAFAAKERDDEPE